MLRQHFPERVVGDEHFRWRGGDVSRVESLADMVFAFALTLLVVSLDVPRTVADLKAALMQLPAFAFSFTMLVMAWWYHYIYHRRYGFEDFPSFVLNALLLFVILFYVYPLKFLSTVLQTLFLGEGAGALAETVGAEGGMSWLMAIYSSGVALVFGLFCAMHVLAWRRRELLELDARERLLTRAAILSHAGSASIGLLSIALALAFPDDWRVSLAGWAYFLMWPLHMTLGIRTGKRLERLAAES